MKKKIWFPILACTLLASIFIYPIFQGLILLPLDLLVSNSGPWHLASQILLKNDYMTDSVVQMYPWKHLTFTSLTSGIVPLWNPYSFLGMPFMAGMKSVVWYPGNFLFFLGELRSWNGLLWLQLFLSLWFMFLFVRSFGRSMSASLLSAISFAFSSLMVGVLEFGSEGHVLLWLPLMLLYVRNIRNSYWFGVGLSLIVAFAVFAGQLQYLAYMMLFVLVFATYEKVFWSVFCFVIWGLVLSSIQLLPAIQLFLGSIRAVSGGQEAFTSGLLWPYHLLRFFSPDWFGNPVTHDLHSGYIETAGYFGIIPLFLCFFAMDTNGREKIIRLFTWVFWISILFSLNGFGHLLFLFHVPLITNGIGGRIISMALVSGSVLAGFGLDAFLKSDTKTRMRVLAWFCMLFLECVIFGVVSRSYHAPYAVNMKNLAYPLLIFIFFVVSFFIISLKAFKWRIKWVLFTIVVCMLTYADVFRMGYRFLTFSNPKFLYPELSVISYVKEKTQSSLGRTYGLVEPEVNVVFQMPIIETYNPLFPVRTANFLSALEDAQPTAHKDNKFYLAQNERMKFVLDFLGVSYIVPVHNINPAYSWWHNSVFENDLRKELETDGSDVYRNMGAYPRFSLFYDVRSGISDEEALNALRHRTVDFRQTVLIRQELKESFVASTGSAELLSYSLNEASFSIDTQSPAIFYLSDAYNPDWEVYVNGKRTELLEANYAMRAVRVPEGQTKVFMQYKPRIFLVGVWLSGISMFLLFIYGILRNTYINSESKTSDKRYRKPGVKTSWTIGK